MIGQSDNQFKADLYKLRLMEQPDPNQPLYILAQTLP